MMKLLIEQVQDTKIILESASDNEPKQYFIEGIYMQAGKVNINRRIYPKPIIENQVRVFDEKIQRNRAVGSLDHPADPTVKLADAAHKIVSLKLEGNDAHGRSLIMETPLGIIAKRLIDANVELGMSSRAVGSTILENNVSVVQDDFELQTVDIVSDPSAHDAFVTAIMENREWIYENGILVEREIEIIQKQVRAKCNMHILESIFSKVMAKHTL